MSDEILIAGLESVGPSIALAFRQAKLAVGLVGYDPDPKVSRAAVKAHVVDRMITDLRDLPAQSDLLFLCLRPPEMLPALEQITPHLAEGALIIGIGPLQSPLVAWCAEHLLPGRAYVGAFLVEGPSAVGPDPESEPSPDRFSGGVMGLVLPHGVPPSGIEVANSLARLLGAKVFFLDSGELDSACASAEAMPLLLTSALMNASTSQPGWRDTRRLTSRTFARATNLLADLSAGPAARWLSLSAPSLVPKLDTLISELSDWRASLAAGDEAAILHRMSQAADAHTAWLSARRGGEWDLDEARIAPPVQGPGFFERMFGLGARRGRKDSR